MVMVTVWWSAAPLIHYSFLNHSESITSEKYAQQIDEMQQKLQQLQPALGNRMGQIHLHDNAQKARRTTNTSKVERIGLWCFASSSIFTWPLADLLPFFKHLNNSLQGKCSHSREAKSAFQELKHGFFFYTTGINKLTSRGQKFINKDVFEPSCNDLNFIVWNCNGIFKIIIFSTHDLLNWGIVNLGLPSELITS